MVGKNAAGQLAGIELIVDVEHRDPVEAITVAARGNAVLGTWVGFLRYDWDVFSRLSRDGGATFASQADVNDTPPADEAIDDSPRAAFAGRTPGTTQHGWDLTTAGRVSY